MKQKILLLSFILFSLIINAQTNISGGNVFGKWTKANSPYRINGNITIPKDSTLSIEPGVSVQFGPRKHLKVDGRILALGKAKSTDSIWFTRQNTRDTNFWRGIKFINTSNSNDTSIFKHCVFTHCKNPYDSSWLGKGGCISIFGYGKIKVAYSSFYKNEVGDGAGIFITNKSFAKISGCTFKNNASSLYYYWDGTFFQPISGNRGSAIYVFNNSNVLIDSCMFNYNLRGVQYQPQPSINYESSTVHISGSTYFGTKAYATITNSVFDGNEGIMLYADDRAVVNVNNCSFVNAPKDKSLYVIFSTERAEVYTRKCAFQNNAPNTLIFALGGIYVSFSDIVSNNVGFKLLYASQRNPASSMNSYASLTNAKVINNKSDNTLLFADQVRVDKLTSCLFANNELPRFLRVVDMFNTTIVNNYSSTMLMYCDNAYRIYNNIIWGNKCDSANGRQISVSSGNSSFFRNNIIEKDSNNFWLPGRYLSFNSRGMPSVYDGNLKSNPEFVNPTTSHGASYNAANADFSLKSTCSLQSPAINASYWDTALIKLPQKDLNSNTRFFENKLDIGAYENVSGSPQIKILNQTLKDSLCEKSRAAQLSLTAIGRGLQYQWQQSTNIGTSWSNISGQTSDKLILPNTNSSQNKNIYRVLMSGTCDKDTTPNMSVITFELPQVDLGKDTSICYGTILSKQSNLNGTYLWHTGNTSNNLTQAIFKDSVWWLQVTNQKGCKNRDTLKITNVTFPIVDLGEDRNLYKDEEITLNAGAGDYTYLWNNGSTSQYRTFKGQDLGVSGDYNLWAQVSNKQGCASRDSIKVTVLGFTSLNPINQIPISIYPLPAQDYLNINLPLQWFTNTLNLTIKSIDGKVIQQQEITETQTTLPVSHLKSGIYLISINNGSENIHLKWVKQ